MMEQVYRSGESHITRGKTVRPRRINLILQMDLRVPVYWGVMSLCREEPIERWFRQIPMLPYAQ